MFRAIVGWILSRYISATPRHRGKIRLVGALFKIFPRVPVRSRYGCLMLSKADVTTVRSVVGTYDAVHDHVTKLTDGMAFIDIGANAGVFALVAAQRVGPGGRVVAFEPASGTFQLLMENIGLNRFSNVVAVNAALGVRTGMARFEVSPTHSGKAHLSDRGSAEILQVGPAEAQPLLLALAGDRETIVKIDVEGAELLVLRAIAPFLQSARVSSVVAEIDPDLLSRFGTTPEDVYRALGDLGFHAEMPEGSSSHYDQVFTRSGEVRRDEQGPGPKRW